MKVAYIVNEFPKLSETFILNEIVQAQKQGVEIEVLAFSQASEDRIHPDVAYVRHISYFQPARKLSALTDHLYWLFKYPGRYLKALGLACNRMNGITRWFLFNLHNVRLVERTKADHLHAHFGTWTADMTMLAGILTGIPYTFTTHSYDIFSFPPHNFQIKSQLAKKHITVSIYNKNYLAEHFKVPPECIEVVHCGVDFTKINGSVAKPSSNKIVTIARLENSKRLDHLVKTYARLKDRIDFEAIVIGDGTQRMMLENLINDLGLKGRVRLLGNRTQNNIFEILQTCRLMVMTSTVEGIPVSLMEALAFRIPVVATKITGIPELIDDGKSGFLVDPHDMESLIERIEQLLNDEALRARFVEQGHDKVKREFNLEREVSKLIAIWKS